MHNRRVQLMKTVDYWVNIVRYSEALEPRLVWLMAAGAYPGFCSMKRLEVFLLPLDGMLIHRRSLPRNLLGFPKNNLRVPIYTPGWREALWELSVLPKNITQCPRTALSRVENTNHEATAPPTIPVSSRVWQVHAREISRKLKEDRAKTASGRARSRRVLPYSANWPQYNP